MAQKFRGGQTQASYDAAKAKQKARPDAGEVLTPEKWEEKTGNKLLSYTSTSSGNLSKPLSWMKKSDWVAQQNPLATAYEKMGIGKTGDLGGRMGELEKASMRLGEAASQRRIGEIGSEYDSRRKLQEAQADIEARQLGYKGLPAMQRYLEDKRREEELLSKKALSSEGGWLRRV